MVGLVMNKLITCVHNNCNIYMYRIIWASSRENLSEAGERGWEGRIFICKLARVEISIF